MATITGELFGIPNDQIGNNLSDEPPD